MGHIFLQYVCIALNNILYEKNKCPLTSENILHHLAIAYKLLMRGFIIETGMPST